MKCKIQFIAIISFTAILISSCASHRNQLGCPYGIQEVKTESAPTQNNYLKVSKCDAVQTIG